MTEPGEPVHLWIRSECRSTERRTPIVPKDAGTLVSQGYRVTVEDSSQRVFSTADYAEAGCSISPAGSWVDAPADAYIVGIKELPASPDHLRHTHIYFAHAYKGQDGAQDLLGRFARGGGSLLDVEYLTIDGRRVVAFGYWAGYVGACLSMLQHAGTLEAPLEPTSAPELDAAVRDTAPPQGQALVIGARGRSGTGACDALTKAGWATTPWGLRDTRTVDHETIRAHDLLLNCVVSDRPQEPFVTCADLDVSGRRLRVIGDVTCDVTSANNLVPLNDAITTWDDPVRRFPRRSVDAVAPRSPAEPPPLDVIAVDNLPSLVPVEASVSFSADFTAQIGHLAHCSGPFAEARETFVRAMAGQAPGTSRAAMP